MQASQLLAMSGDMVIDLTTRQRIALFPFAPTFYLQVRESCFREQSGVEGTYTGYEAHDVVL